MNSVSRRTFLKSGVSAGALVLSVSAVPRVLAQDEAVNAGHVTSCLRVDEDGRVVLCVPTPDMGQGMITTAAQLIAEELDIDLDSVSVELMPFAGKFDEEGRAVFDRFYQGAGGSGSTMRIWHELRRTAAFARALFIDAASQEWGTLRDGLYTDNGGVIDSNGNRLEYSSLVAAARALGDDLSTRANSRPNGVSPKASTAFKTIGKDRGNVHARDIATGAPLFGIDAEVPGMLHAVIRRCPHLKGDLVGFDAAAAHDMPGVKAVVPMQRLPEDRAQYRKVAAGVAVVADTFWHAKKASEALDIEWDGSLAANDDTGILREKVYRALDTAEMTVAAESGNLQEAFDKAPDSAEAIYFHPHWAHTCMEPHSCVAHVRDDQTEIWVAHQFMDAAINGVTEAIGVPADKVKGHFLRMGTGFGRKYEQDFVMEACILSKEVGAPVKVTWTREDEIEQDYVNPLTAYKVSAALDGNGDITAWHMRAASDTQAVIVAREFPIGIVDTYKGEWWQQPTHISRGAWRGPHHNVAAWVIQSFLDELAAKAGRDPLDYLTDLYARKKGLRSLNWPQRDIYFERHIAVLKKAASEAGWGEKLPAGWGRGIAVHYTFVSVCAHVVELEMTSQTDFRVHRVTSAIDCGLAVNPNGVRAQVESGVIDGICAAKYGKLVYKAGVPVNNNFDSYRKMRIGEAPAEINVHILDFGDEEPRGTGEVSLPPVIPALTNAIFAASGKRVRELPISL